MYRLRTLLVAAVLVACGGVRADIYGFVDEHGVAHLSSTPLDHRYYLFKKEPRPPVLPGADETAATPVPAPRRTTHVNPAYRKQYTPLIVDVARENKLEPALLHALITVESGYDPKARSSKGAIGLMQLMPETARRYQVNDIWDPLQNLRGGARYLRDLLAMFDQNLSLALAAYNAGEAAVVQYGNRIPPYAETRSYVPRVLQQYHLLNNAGK